MPSTPHSVIPDILYRESILNKPLIKFLSAIIPPPHPPFPGIPRPVIPPPSPRHPQHPHPIIPDILYRESIHKTT